MIFATPTALFGDLRGSRGCSNPSKLAQTGGQHVSRFVDAKCLSEDWGPWQGPARANLTSVQSKQNFVNPGGFMPAISAYKCKGEDGGREGALTDFVQGDGALQM